MLNKITAFFKSVKLSVVLILLLSVLALIGIIFPQIPSSLSAYSDGYTWWINNIANAQFGAFTNTIGFLGFFDIFHSIWFFGTVLFLMLNILVCSLGRYKGVKTKSGESKIETNRDFYVNSKFHREFQSNSLTSSSQNEIDAVLDKHRYHFSKTTQADAFFYTGSRNRFSVYGTYLVHLSLFIFILGILLGSLFGFRNDSFIVFEDTTKEVGYNTDMSIRLNSFSDEYWSDGSPKDYSSDVVLYKNGQIVKSGLIQVNHPLVYEGVRFHQSFFGPAIGFKIATVEGKLIFDENVALDDVRTLDSLQRPVGNITLPGNTYSVVILKNATNGQDTVIRENQVGIELYDDTNTPIAWLILDKNSPQTLGNITFTFTGESKFSGFQVSKDPGSYLIWIASLLFILGIAIIFYFPHRQIWIAVYATPSDSSNILIKLSSAKDLGLDIEMTNIVRDFKKILDLKESAN